MVVQLRIIASQGQRPQDMIAWLKDIQRRRIPNGAQFVTKSTAKNIAQFAKEHVRQRASKYHGKKPGRLVESIRAIPDAKTSKQVAYTVIADTPYAKYVERGTRQHPEPNNPFRNTWSTAPEHPGTKATNFMKDAFERELRFVEKKLETAFDFR